MKVYSVTLGLIFLFSAAVWLVSVVCSYASKSCIDMHWYYVYIAPTEQVDSHWALILKCSCAALGMLSTPRVLLSFILVA